MGRPFFISLEVVVPGWLGSEDVVDDIIVGGNVSLEERSLKICAKVETLIKVHRSIDGHSDLHRDQTTEELYRCLGAERSVIHEIG